MNKWRTILFRCTIILLTCAIAMFFLQLCHYQYDFAKTLNFIDIYTKLFLLQTLIIASILLWFYFLFDSISMASFITSFLAICIGIGTQQKSLYRGEPVYPSDIYFLKDFSFLLEMLELPMLIAISIVFIFLVSAIVFYILKKKRRKKSTPSKVSRTVGLLTMSFFIFYCSQFNQPNNLIKEVFASKVEWISYSQEKNYSQNGVVSGILYNLKSPAVAKPEVYSQKEIERIFLKYSQEAEMINKTRSGNINDYNIIYVMSETFSDPMKIKGVELSEDPIPLYRNLTTKYLSGESLSQGYGGGTANIEFEALTGISLEPLAANITTPFIQLSDIMSKIPSMVRFFDDYSHKKTAIHPYNTTMYKRLENYIAFGFDEYFFHDDMDFDMRIDNSTHISDESAYKQVLQSLKTSEERDFIHLVTMQNHKPFVNKYNDVNIKVSGAPYNLEVAHYATGLKYSDQALVDFLSQLDKLNEKTIVVFWGDHLPSFYGAEGTELFDLNGKVVMAQTPLLIYTNYDSDVRDIGTISPIYFANYVLEKADAPMTPFIALLDKLESELPAFKKGIYLEHQSTVKEERKSLHPSTIEVLEEYDTILYDITTGKNYSQDLGFY